MKLIESYELEGGISIPMWVYTKGKIDITEFINAYKKEYGVLLNDEDVKQQIIRYVPIQGMTSEQMILENQKAGRGAFWVTYVDTYRMKYPTSKDKESREWSL